MVIWKFDLEYAAKQGIEMPHQAVILSVGLQNGGLKLWASCDPSAEKAIRTIYLVGTGHLSPSDPYARFRGTVMDGEFVWHIFARD
jgi:hypothetical protein